MKFRIIVKLIIYNQVRSPPTENILNMTCRCFGFGGTFSHSKVTTLLLLYITIYIEISCECSWGGI